MTSSLSSFNKHSAREKLPTVAVVGGGIAGLTAAYKLRHQAQVTLFEAANYVGGHTNTIDISLEGIQYPVDTGFLVFNERTYPHLIALFKELEVETTLSDMSFGISLPEIDLEWAGTSLDTVFAQRQNLLRPRFLRMLQDVLRFNKQATAMAQQRNTLLVPQYSTHDMHTPLGTFLNRNNYSTWFRDWYLLPMAAAIWSCPSAQMLQFPIGTFINFCHNHGLLQVQNRPRWYTVKGGARNYVHKMLQHIHRVLTSTPVIALDTLGARPVIRTERGLFEFDAIVLACHSDQALDLLQRHHFGQRDVLQHIRYQPNTAYLHTDTTLMPKRNKVWSAWNYLSDVSNPQPSVSVTYWLNKLQPMPFKTPVLVTLNPIVQPATERIIQEIHYSHPIFDGPAIQAQKALPSVQGEHGVYLAGAWTGYGFHEDGHTSGLRVADAITRDWAIGKQQAVA